MAYPHTVQFTQCGITRCLTFPDLAEAHRASEEIRTLTGITPAVVPVIDPRLYTPAMILRNSDGDEYWSGIPIYQGGQGREAADMHQSGSIMAFVLMFAGAVTILGAMACVGWKLANAIL